MRADSVNESAYTHLVITSRGAKTPQAYIHVTAKDLSEAMLKARIILLEDYPGSEFDIKLVVEIFSMGSSRIVFNSESEIE